MDADNLNAETLTPRTGARLVPSRSASPLQKPVEFFDAVPLSTRCELGQLALRFMGRENRRPLCCWIGHDGLTKRFIA